MDTGTSLPREVSTRGRPGRGGVPSSGDRLLTSNMRVKPGVQMPPGRRAHRMDDPDSDRGRRAPGLRVHPEPDFRLRRQVWLGPQLPGDAGSRLPPGT